jgi:fatty acid-binding protein DegV
VAIFVSELLSGTLQSAHLGAAEMGDYPIEIVDSRSVSLGLGLLAVAAARYAAQNDDYKAVAEYVRALGAPAAGCFCGRHIGISA